MLLVVGKGARQRHQKDQHDPEPHLFGCNGHKKDVTQSGRPFHFIQGDDKRNPDPKSTCLSFDNNVSPAQRKEFLADGCVPFTKALPAIPKKKKLDSKNRLSHFRLFVMVIDSSFN